MIIYTLNLMEVASAAIGLTFLGGILGWYYISTAMDNNKRTKLSTQSSNNSGAKKNGEEL
jgi:hypothetical protein